MPERRKIRWPLFNVGVVAFAVMAAVAVEIVPFRRYQTVRTYIADAAGIDENTPVRCDGLPAGAVGAVKLSGSKDPARAVELDLRIQSKSMRDIPADSTATVTAGNQPGSKSIDITRGRSRAPVQPGGELLGIVPEQDVPEWAPVILPISVVGRIGFGGRPIVAAAAFPGGQSRMKAGCGQNCPPYKAKLKSAGIEHGAKQ